MTINILLPLKVSLQLLTANRDFSSERNRNKDKPPTLAALSPQCKTSPRTQQLDSDGDELPAESFEDSRLPVWTPEEPTKENFSHPQLQRPDGLQQQHQVEEKDSEILLYTLLMVPDGKNFRCGSVKGPNVYLNCKLFWCDEIARSVVSWGQTNPTFSFVQVRVPVQSSFFTRLHSFSPL